MTTTEDLERVSAVDALAAIGQAFNKFDAATKQQSVLDVALHGADDPLEVVHAILSDVLDYLSSRDDCYDKTIDDATDAIYTAMRRVKCQQEEIEDANGDFDDKHDIDRNERVRDVQLTQRGR